MKKIIPLLFLLIIVFISSGQTSDQQSIVPMLERWLPSKPLEPLLAHLQIPYWGIIVSIEERGYYNFVEFLVRKATHFFYFGAIALAIYAVLPRFKFCMLIAAILTLLFAMADEYHQSLTSGRVASVQDVMLDLAGGITALLVWKSIKVMKQRKSAKV